VLKYATVEILGPAQLAFGGTPRLLKNAHRHEFNYTPRFGMIYVRSRMISSRCNDNFDNFPAEEIAKGWRSFIGKPVFVNHHNDDHRQMRGLIIDAVLHNDRNPDGTPDTWVEGLMEVDGLRFPMLAKALILEQIQRTSMGVDVDYSICSACGNKATTPLEYCRHVPGQKGMKLSRLGANGKPVKQLIYESCYGLRFFENSLLVEAPADPTAYFLGNVHVGPGLEHLARTASRVTGEPKPDDLKEVLSGVTLGKDDDGYFVYTHRARSKSYPDPHGIPQKKIDFVESTGARKVAAFVPRLPPMDPRALVAPPPVWDAFARVAYGETVAPADVDTLRDESCSVCGEQDAWDGNICAVCGYVAPPKAFRDPDLDVAKQLDLRKQQDAFADSMQPVPGADGLPGDEQPDLVCNNCGTEFPAAEPTSIDTEDPQAGADPMESEDPETQEEGLEGGGDASEGDVCPACGKGVLVSGTEVAEETGEIPPEEGDPDEELPPGEEPEDEDPDEEEDEDGPVDPRDLVDEDEEDPDDEDEPAKKKSPPFK
jgi:hypothetical protein